MMLRKTAIYGGPPRPRHRLLALLPALLTVTAAWGQAADPVDRTMYFIDKAAEATELLNDKPAEALAILQELATSYADEDEDGFVGISLGDCLAELKRYDEARAAYNAVIATHPDLQERVSGKMAELDVTGEITDDALNRLRVEAQGADKSAEKWRLGRALQKRAAGYLTEAVATFKSFGVPSAVGATGLPSTLGSEFDAAAGAHAGQLEEILKDLNALIKQIEERWKIKMDLTENKENRDGPVTEQRRVEQVLRTPDGRRYEIVLRRENQDRPAQITVNGRVLELTKEQRRVIKQHQERIDNLLIQATQTMEASQTSQR